MRHFFFVHLLLQLTRFVFVTRRIRIVRWNPANDRKEKKKKEIPARSHKVSVLSRTSESFENLLNSCIIFVASFDARSCARSDANLTVDEKTGESNKKKRKTQEERNQERKNGNGRPRRGRVKHESNFLHENRDIPWLVLYIVHSLDSPTPFPTLPHHQSPSERST